MSVVFTVPVLVHEEQTLVRTGWLSLVSRPAATKSERLRDESDASGVGGARLKT